MGGGTGEGRAVSGWEVGAQTLKKHSFSVYSLLPSNVCQTDRRVVTTE
jgi:hypothetical protein